MIQPVPRAGSGVAAEDAAHAAVIRRYEERLAKDPSSLAFAPLADAYRKVGRDRGGHPALPRRASDASRTTRPPGSSSPRRCSTKGKGTEASAALETIVAAGARDAEAHRLLGEIHRKAGRLEPALEHLEQAARLDPRDRESRLAAEMLRGRGQAPEGSPLAGLLADDTFATETLRDAVPRPGAGRRGGADASCAVLQTRTRATPGARERLEQALRTQDAATERAIAPCWCPRRISRRGSRSSSTGSRTASSTSSTSSRARAAPSSAPSSST